MSFRLTLTCSTSEYTDPERCGVIKYTSLNHTVSNNKQHTMSKSVYVSLLRQGNTGNEILSILDSIASDTVSNTESSQSYGGGEPTAFELQF